MTDTKASDRRAAGFARRRRMFGPQGAEAAVESASDFMRPLEEIVTEFCFGEVWGRPPLDDKTRSMLTIAILTALGRGPQLKNHVKGAIANGATPEEIREVILHTLLYAGIPAAVEATRVAEEALKEMK